MFIRSVTNRAVIGQTIDPLEFYIVQMKLASSIADRPSVLIELVATGLRELSRFCLRRQLVISRRQNIVWRETEAPNYAILARNPTQSSLFRMLLPVIYYHCHSCEQRYNRNSKRPVHACSRYC